MKNMKKKGFTLIELVIVVAIISILAAVLIPTVAGIIDKAETAKATQIVKNLNTAVAADTSSKHETAGDAFKAAELHGYDVALINQSGSAKEILWDSLNKVFCYIDDTDIKYIVDENDLEFDPDDMNSLDYWSFGTKTDTNEYSNFIYSYNGTTITTSKNIEIGEKVVGVDAVHYITDSDHTATIITNGQNLLVNAPNGSVNHDGAASNVTIEAVKSASYHEFGDIAGNITVNAGRLVLESGSSVERIVVEATAAVSIDNSKAPEVPVVIAAGSSASNVTLSDSTNKVELDENSAILIGSNKYDSFDAAWDAVKAEENVTITLLKTVSTSKFIKIDNNVTIDLNGNTLNTNGVTNDIAIQVSSGASLTVKDSGENSGAIVSANAAFASACYGKIYVYGGKIANTFDDVYYCDAEALRIGMSGAKRGIGYIYGGEFESKNMAVNNSGELHIQGGSFKVTEGSDWYSNSGIANCGYLYIEGDVETDGFYCSNSNATGNGLPVGVTVKDGCKFTVKNSLLFYEEENKNLITIAETTGEFIFSYGSTTKKVAIPATSEDDGYVPGDTWPRPIGSCVYWTMDR